MSSIKITNRQLNKLALLIACLLLFLSSQAILLAQGGAPKPAKPDWSWLTAIPAFKGMQAKPIYLDALEASLKKKGLLIDWDGRGNVSLDGRYVTLTFRPLEEEGNREDTENDVIIDLKDCTRVPIPLPDGLPAGKGEMSFCFWDRQDPKLYYAEFIRNDDGPSTAWCIRIGGKAERLIALEENVHIVDILPDNRLLVSLNVEDKTKPEGRNDLYFYQELGGERKRTPLPDPDLHKLGSFSPDGKWKAYFLPQWWEEWGNNKTHAEKVTYIENVATQVRTPVFSDRQLRFAFPAEYESIHASGQDWLPDSTGLLLTPNAWKGSEPGPTQIWTVTIQGEARHISDMPDNAWIFNTSYNYRHWLIMLDDQMYMIDIPKK